jgi:hypothetical protein
MKDSHDVARTELDLEQEALREMKKMLKALASTLRALCQVHGCCVARVSICRSQRGLAIVGSDENIESTKKGGGHMRLCVEAARGRWGRGARRASSQSTRAT